jgi:hypothetical protein
MAVVQALVQVHLANTTILAAIFEGRFESRSTLGMGMPHPSCCQTSGYYLGHSIAGKHNFIYSPVNYMSILRCRWLGNLINSIPIKFCEFLITLLRSSTIRERYTPWYFIWRYDMSERQDLVRIREVGRYAWAPKTSSLPLVACLSPECFLLPAYLPSFD